MMMNNHGGRRKGAGRPPKALALLPKGSIDPLKYLQSVVDDKNATQAERIDCANKIARFYHPILSATDQTIKTEVDVIHKIETTFVSPDK